MKSLKLLGIPSLIAVSSVIFAADDKAVITALYAKLDGLTVKKNITDLKKVINETCSKDFTYTGADGASMTLENMLTNMETQMKAIDKVSKSKSNIIKCVIVKDLATLTVRSDTEMTGTNPADQKKHSIKTSDLSTDTWKKVGGKWMLKSVKVTSSSVWQDGKKISG